MSTVELRPGHTSVAQWLREHGEEVSRTDALKHCDTHGYEGLLVVVLKNMGRFAKAEVVHTIAERDNLLCDGFSDGSESCWKVREDDINKVSHLHRLRSTSGSVRRR